MNNSKEVWRDIQGYDGRYRVSNYGRVLSIKAYTNVRMGTKHIRKHVLKPQINNSGYLGVMLHNDGGYKHYYLHRLVAKTFIDNPNNLPTVNHKNGNKHDNYVSNLEWSSYSENNMHAYRHGLTHSNKNNDHMSIKIKAYDLSGNLKYEFPSMREAERQLGLSNGAVHMAVKKGWHYASLVWKVSN